MPWMKPIVLHAVSPANRCESYRRLPGVAASAGCRTSLDKLSSTTNQPRLSADRWRLYLALLETFSVDNTL